MINVYRYSTNKHGHVMFYNINYGTTTARTYMGIRHVIVRSGMTQESLAEMAHLLDIHIRKV